ncbi:ABC transporter permease subunit [Arachnia propionica]|uniref:ABC transporter permease subunit n=1 Tax=Arachnia propionica TaxID=1750 RepID=A0A3P1TAW8_9ACTN|nr:ABC transporter permease subunit [Arachnia propionica]MDO5084648.1 ABC transporter permease subunit [Arachnia propionica]RRD06554.1 ABC transporter permease subunit [Arachnia propionica]
MTRSSLRSLPVLIGAFLVAALFAGSLPWLTGSDPARTVLRARQVERDADPAALEAIRQSLDLPENPLLGTWQWIVKAFRGDFGVSWVSGTPVAEKVGSSLLVSLNLSGMAAATTLALGFVCVGPMILSVGRGKGGTSRVLRVVSSVLAALPEFVLAVLLAFIFAVRLRWFPATGWQTGQHAVLPVAAISVASVGVLLRVLMTAVTAVADEDWVRTWRANGARPARISAEVARRALAVVLPQVFLLLAGIVGASVVVEDTFAIPGLGRTALNAALAQDVPVVQGAMAVLVLLGVVVGALGNLLHHWLMAPALGAGQGTALVRHVGTVRRGWGWWSCVALLVVLIVGGWFRSSAIDPLSRHQGPSWAHPLGADHVGRDVWARVGEGAWLTIGSAVALTLICLVIGLLVGLASREGSAGITDILNAIPSVFLGVVLAAALGPGMFSAWLAICIVGWIPLAVHARTLAAEARAAGFHQAAITSGATRWWITRRHILPSVFRPVLGHALVRLPHLALALTGLSFLGLGAGHDSPEWGKMLSDAVSHMEQAPWTVLFPALGLVLLGLVTNLARAE